MNEDDDSTGISKRLRLMSSGIAHEINNLLGVIVGNAHLVSKRVGADHEAAPFIDEIRSATDEARELMHRLGSLGSDRAPRLRAMDLNSIVQDIAKSMVTKLPESVAIETSVDESLPPAMMDVSGAVPLIQEVIELLGNTSDPEGPLRIETYLEEKAGIRFALLRIADTGVLPSGDELELAFEPFQKFQGRLRPHLLLIRAKDMMERAGGFVRAEGNAPTGLALTFGFPTEASELLGSNADAALPKATALLCVTDKKMVLLVREALRSLGWNVESYDNVTALTEALKSDKSLHTVAIVNDSSSLAQLNSSISANQKLHLLMLGQCDVDMDVGMDVDGVTSIAVPFTAHVLKEAAVAALKA